MGACIRVSEFYPGGRGHVGVVCSRICVKESAYLWLCAYMACLCPHLCVCMSHMYAFMRVSMWGSMRLCVCLCACLSVRIYLCIVACVGTCMCVSVAVYACGACI